MVNIKHGVAGGIAGITVDLIFYPLDTIKTRIMGSTPGQNLVSIAKSRFKGFSCQMIVSFPYSFTFFYTYQTVRKYLNYSLYANIIASISAQIAGNLVRNPFEVVKQQLMVGRSDHILLVFKQIVSIKGVKGFYTGFNSTIARDIVFSAFQLPLFQYFRQNIFINNPNGVISGAVSGSLAAAIAGFISCPFDVIKTRLMTQKFDQSTAQNMVKQIYSENGLGGFFKGVGFRCGILSFGGIIYFGALMQARKIIGLDQHQVKKY